MKVTHVKVEFGVTQNIGDYSNVKPSIVIEADLEEGEIGKKAASAIDNLIDEAHRRIHAIIDDELEGAGMRPRYHDGPLFCIQYSDVRKCFVLLPEDTALPQESNWKVTDYWYSGGKGLGQCHDMRAATITPIWTEFKPKDGYVKIDCSLGDFSILPPLPDYGPEPRWHKLSLSNYFSAWNIDEALWDELGDLEYIDRDYCSKLNQMRWDKERWPKDIVEFIRNNHNTDQMFPPEPEPDRYDDEDEEEYEDERS